jgi:hypothetical protein
MIMVMAKGGDETSWNRPNRPKDSLAVGVLFECLFLDGYSVDDGAWTPK